MYSYYLVCFSRYKFTIINYFVIFTNNYLSCLLAPKIPDTLREQLKTAMKEKDRFVLEKIILQCEAAAFPELGSDLREAREVLQHLGGGRGG